MAKNETVTLPAPNPGNCWRQVPESYDTYIDGNGKVDTTYHTEMDGEQALAPVLLAACIGQGIKRYFSTATTSMKDGETEKEAVDRRVAEFLAGTYKPGSGGGARKSTYFKVLHESVVKVLLNYGFKKVDATKKANDGESAAFMLACHKESEKTGKNTPDEIFADMWPKIESAAKAEAERRDEAESSSFDLGAFAA